jgi:hypothetical protein
MLKLARNLPVPAKTASGKNFENRAFSAKTQSCVGARFCAGLHDLVFSLKKTRFLKIFFRGAWASSGQV